MGFDNEDVDPFMEMEALDPDQPEEEEAEQAMHDQEVEEYLERKAKEELQQKEQPKGGKKKSSKPTNPYAATKGLEATARRECAAGKNLCLWNRGVVPKQYTKTTLPKKSTLVMCSLSTRRPLVQRTSHGFFAKYKKASGAQSTV